MYLKLGQIKVKIQCGNVDLRLLNVEQDRVNAITVKLWANHVGGAPSNQGGARCVLRMLNSGRTRTICSFFVCLAGTNLCELRVPDYGNARLSGERL